jgi:uncharacterized membrane protein YhaH (DUF805 family)
MESSKTESLICWAALIYAVLFQGFLRFDYQTEIWFKYIFLAIPLLLLLCNIMVIVNRIIKRNKTKIWKPCLLLILLIILSLNSFHIYFR